MKINYLVDTDWVISHLIGRLEYTQKLAQLRPHGLGVSVVSLAELFEGVYYSQDQQKSEEKLKEFLQDTHYFGIDEETARIFGKERGLLRKKGMIIGDFDLLIAATALRFDLTLLSSNRRHYERIDGLEIIAL